MPHEPSCAVSRRGICLHAVQHGGVSCIGFTKPSVAMSGHAWQLCTEPLCSVQRMKGRGVRGPRGPHLHGGWGRVLDFVLVHVLIRLTVSAVPSRGSIRHCILKKDQANACYGESSPEQDWLPPPVPFAP